jgi:hypothetical protein
MIHLIILAARGSDQERLCLNPKVVGGRKAGLVAGQHSSLYACGTFCCACSLAFSHGPKRWRRRVAPGHNKSNNNNGTMSPRGAAGRGVGRRRCRRGYDRLGRDTRTSPQSCTNVCAPLCAANRRRRRRRRRARLHRKDSKHLSGGLQAARPASGQTQRTPFSGGAAFPKHPPCCSRCVCDRLQLGQPRRSRHRRRRGRHSLGACGPARPAHPRPPPVHRPSA